MNFNVYQSHSSVATREILLVGFAESFTENIVDFPFQNPAYLFVAENNPINAIGWLEQRVGNIESFQLPYAIICQLQWLRKDNFQLIRQITAHPFLRYVPIIAMTNQNEIADKTMFTQHGIDDCYQVPVSWEMLETRLEFLNQYKSQIVDHNPPKVTPKVTRPRLPLEKRIFDVISAVFGILISCPLWIPIAIAIRLESKGPVIYRSKRVGSRYHIFDFLKFRSMYADADQRLHELKHLNQYGDQENPVFLKLSHDPRITRVGRFIRKFSLDELPQFINVLRGDMSLVGNRPLPLYEAEMLVKDESCERFLAPAGLTGLWQVTKRGHTEMSTEERISLDIEYSKTYSVWTDLKIISRTFSALMQHENV